MAGINYPPHTSYKLPSPREEHANLRGSNESITVYIDGYELNVWFEFCKHFNAVLELTIGKLFLNLLFALRL